MVIPAAEIKKESADLLESPKLKSLMLVAGEASGDSHGAELVNALKKLNPELQIFGMGGSRLRNVGMEIVVDTEHSASVMGFSELLGSIKNIWRSYRKLLAEAGRRHPDVVVFIDYPDFNMRLARALKKRGLKTVYYITPQVWAWRSGRVKAMKRDFDLLLPIFPFEFEYYAQRGICTKYVGHPFLDRPELRQDRENFLTSLGASVDCPVIGLLPGSRKAEIERLLPEILAGYEKFLSQPSGDKYQAIIPLAPGIEEEKIRSRAREMLSDRAYSCLFFTRGRAREVLAAAQVSIVASGTATVEAALSGNPFVAVYKLSALSYRIARLLVTGVKNFAMPNIVLGRTLIPELLQDEVTADRIAAELRQIVENKTVDEQIKAGLQELKVLLKGNLNTQGGTASERASQFILELIQ